MVATVTPTTDTSPAQRPSSRCLEPSSVRSVNLRAVPQSRSDLWRGRQGRSDNSVAMADPSDRRAGQRVLKQVADIGLGVRWGVEEPDGNGGVAGRDLARHGGAGAFDAAFVERGENDNRVADRL